MAANPIVNTVVCFVTTYKQQYIERFYLRFLSNFYIIKKEHEFKLKLCYHLYLPETNYQRILK
jgi:hypothetical protein